MSSTATSDWPTPTVSTSTTSKPGGLAQQHRLARAAGDAAERAAGRRRPDERRRARGRARSMRVLSPRIEPPLRVLDGSTASTATRWPCVDERAAPSASMNVDLPDAGRAARCRPGPTPPVRGSSVVEQRVGLVAVVGPGRLDERDRPRQRPPVARRRTAARASSAHARSTRSGRVQARREERRGPRRPPRGCWCPGRRRRRRPPRAGSRSPAAGSRRRTRRGCRRRPACAAASISSGTSVLCPAAWLDTPTTCTSFSTASRAASSGVWNSGPTSTSKPRSANAVAMTLAPRSWPSWPIFTTSMRGRRPSASANASTSARIRSKPSSPSYARAVHAGDATDRRPGGGRTPAPARRRSRRPSPARRVASIDELEQVAVAARRPRVSALERGLARGLVARRPARCCEPRDLLLAHRGVVDVADVDRRLLGEPVLVDADDRPPRRGRPRAWRRAAASSMRSFGMPDSTALVMPPSASTSSMSAHACVGERVR